MGTLKLALQNYIDKTLTDIAQSSTSTLPTAGVVTSINDDGTLNIMTTGGNLVGVGAATTDVQVLGKQVMVITGDGRQTAVPR